MKKHLPLVFFLTLVVLVVSYAYFVEFRGEKHKEQASRILPIESSAIQKILMTNNTGNQENKITLQRVRPNQEEDQWKVTSPITDLADDTTVSSFVDQLTQEKSDIKVTDEEDEGEERSENSDHQDQDRIKKYGLDNPIGSFQVMLEDETSLTVKVGRVEGLNKKTYLMKDGMQDIWIGDSWWKNQLDKKVDEYRSKDVVDFDNPKRIIIVQRDHQNSDHILSEMQFVKTEDSWALDGQIRDAMNDYLEKIKDLRVQEFVPQGTISYDDWILNIAIQENDLQNSHNVKFAPIKGNDAYAYTSPRGISIKLLKSSVEDLINGIEDLKKSPEKLLSEDTKETDTADEKNGDHKKSQ